MAKVEDQSHMSTRNGVYIVQGEMSLVVAALRRNVRGGSHNHQVWVKDVLKKDKTLIILNVVLTN